MCHNLLNHFPTEGNLSCSQSLPLTANRAVNILLCTCISLHTGMSLSVEYIPESKFTRSHLLSPHSTPIKLVLLLFPFHIQGNRNTGRLCNLSNKLLVGAELKLPLLSTAEMRRVWEPQSSRDSRLLDIREGSSFFAQDHTRSCIYSCINQGRWGHAAGTNHPQIWVVSEDNSFLLLALTKSGGALGARLLLEVQGSRLSELIPAQNMRFSRSPQQGKKRRGV